MAALLAFFLYWLILFVACFVVLEYSQRYLYDEVTPAAGLKVACGTMLFALLMAYFRPSYDTMFTSDLGWTVLQAIVWFVVFALVFQFHGPHALLLGLSTFVLTAGLATIAIDSLAGRGPGGGARRVIAPPTKPVRKPAFVPPAKAAVGPGLLMPPTGPGPPAPPTVTR